MDDTFEVTTDLTKDKVRELYVLGEFSGELVKHFDLHHRPNYTHLRLRVQYKGGKVNRVLYKPVIV